MKPIDDASESRVHTRTLRIRRTDNFMASRLENPMARLVAASVFVLAVSGLTGGISFLPAGLGAVEMTMAGLLVLVGAAWSNAVAVALVVRLFTLWLWVALGLGVAFLLRVPAFRTQFNEDEKF